MDSYAYYERKLVVCILLSSSVVVLEYGSDAPVIGTHTSYVVKLQSYREEQTPGM